MTNSVKNERKLQRKWEELQKEKKAYILRKQQEEDAELQLKQWDNIREEWDSDPFNEVP